MIYKLSFTYFVLIGPLNSPMVSVFVQGENYELLRPPHCGYSNVTHPRVTGGNPSKPGEWPWMAALGYENETHPLTWLCGGSLITSRHVLTAAHCVAFTTPRLKYVRLGDVDLTCPRKGTNAITIAVEKKIKHPCYRPFGKYMNDVAVVRLTEDVTFTDMIRPICLPLDYSFQKHRFVGSQSYVIGCGRTTFNGQMSPILRQIEVPVLENRICENAYRYDPRTVIDDRVICAGYILGEKDACHGDSGGPLILRIDRIHYEIGVVSHGRGCAFLGSPGVYTRVTAFLGFITSALN